MIRSVRTVAFVALSLSLVLLASGSLAGQKKPAKPIVDPQVQAMNELYAELLQVIKEHKVDPRRDDLRTIHAKHDAVSKALDEFAHKAKVLMLNRKFLGMDYVRFAESTFPRLSGRVVKVGPEEQWTDLQAAQDDIQPGDVVLLGEGEYVLPTVGGEWRDVAFIGRGQESTTLTCRFENARRVRLADLRIDCKNDEFIRLRAGGSMQVLKCLITNYNSGAGGSNAIFGKGANLLIEDCKFEGRTGRAAKGGSGGDAFDLRGTNYLYARNTDFIDNDEIVRATGFCVFDRCRSMSRSRSPVGITSYEDGFLLIRGNRCKIRGEASAEFDVATDDRELVKHLMDAKALLDDEAKAAVEALGLRDNPRYWATLLHHPDQEIQFLASGRLASLLRRAMPVIKIDKKVLADVPKEMRKPFAAALRSSRALRWLEENEPKLIWNAKLRAFVLKKK